VFEPTQNGQNLTPSFIGSQQRNRRRISKRPHRPPHPSKRLFAVPDDLRRALHNWIDSGSSKPFGEQSSFFDLSPKRRKFLGSIGARLF